MSNIELNLSGTLAKIKKIFERKVTNSIGVDIGTTRVKIVELERKKNQIQLKNCVSVKLKKPLLQPGRPGLISDDAGDVLKDIFKQLHIKSNKINVAAPGFASLVTTLDLPAVEDSEIETLINIEAPKYIPIPLKDVIYDWQTIADPQQSGEEPPKKKSLLPTLSEDDATPMRKILLVALMQDVSKKYEEVLGKAGFQLQCLEIDAFSLKRSLVGNDLANYLVMDIGEKVTNLIITYGGSVVLSRNIDVAGNKITEVVARAMQIDPAKAEQLKYQSGFDLDKQMGTPVIGATLMTIINEAKRAQETFYQAYPDKAIEGVILNGGTSQMKGIKEFVQQQMGMQTVIGNPWAKLVYPPTIEQKLVNQGTLFSVAVGLALVGFEEN